MNTHLLKEVLGIRSAHASVFSHMILKNLTFETVTIFKNVPVKNEASNEHVLDADEG